MIYTYVRHVIIYTLIIVLINQKVSAYTFGLLSHNDTVESIQNIEAAHNIYVPMVSFIWDDYNEQAMSVVTNLHQTLGAGRIYHITLSPREYTTEQIVGGYFDWEYSLLFKNIKQSGIKVVFRTMHEMNGGWYPWSGDPASFKQARKKIYQLSREAGLDQSQILFDFSTNGWDMPTSGGVTASQSAPLITCTQSYKKESNCLTRENYYPGDEYVDMIGVTFYNWGKATSDRQRLTPSQIMEEPRFMIRKRLIQKNKPIIVDEVGTTSVRYNYYYDRDASLYHYETNTGAALKNIWLNQLAIRAKNKPQLAAISYFNVDRTIGLEWENPGEADWSVIDLEHDRYYSSIMKLYQGGNNNLAELFVTPEQKKKQHIGAWKKGTIKKKPTNKTGSIISSKSNTQ